MSEVIIVALISLLGTVIGSVTGIVASTKLTNYRIEQLERKVDAHNNLIDRMYNVERCVDLLDQREKVTEHRLDDLEQQ